MIFLDFLWVFIFMVLIDSRPMLKSMHDANNQKSKVSHRAHENNKYIPHEPKIDYNSKNLKFNRRLINEETDISSLGKGFSDDEGFSKYSINAKYSRKSNRNLSHILETLTTEIGTLKRLYGLDDFSSSTLLDDAFEPATQKPQELSLLDGTAEIEAALDEIKQRSIQMMVEQLPSVTEIITSTVTQTAFDVRSNENYSKVKIRCKKECHNNSSKDIHSIKSDAVTFAYKVENMLQKKLKYAYSKIKQKMSSDLKKEVNETRSTIKSEITKISKSKHKTKAKKMKCQHTLAETYKPTSTPYKFTTKTLETSDSTHEEIKKSSKTHSGPKVTDDYSMLSIYEQLLMKSPGNKMLDKLLTPKKLMKETLAKRNLIQTTNSHNLRKRLEKKNHYDEIYDVADYSEEDFSTSEAATIANDSNSSSTKGISIGALSNKIAYNDYVNGFKYYLNFQREQENDNFSNLVRYQAHKHHNVDDVGKYILSKIPQLPSTRSRRYLFEQETLEEQDISTKSEDSWFKKHFYFFIDKDTPKRFHTSQTVSLKSGTDQVNSTNETTPRSQKTSKCESKSKSKNSKKALKKRYNLNKKHIRVRSAVNNLFEKASVTTNGNKNTKKNGFVDITMVQRPTGIVKLEKNKKKHKLKLFNRFSFKKTPGGNKKREILYRKTRFNPFKKIKNMFKNSINEGNTAMTKIFDYEIITSSLNPFQSLKFGHRSNIDNIFRQIPNITGNMEPSFDFENENFISKGVLGSRKYLHNDDFYNVRTGNDFEMNRFSVLPENRVEALERSLQQHNIDNVQFNTYFDDNRRFDDIINVRIKTDPPLMNMWNITLPPLSTLSKDNINNDIDKLPVSMSYFGEDQLKRLDFMTGNNIPKKIDYDNEQTNFLKDVTESSYMNDYQTYDQNIPFRLNLQKTTTNFETRDGLKTNEHKENISVNKYDTNNIPTTGKYMAKNCKLYNVKLFKNSLTTDNSYKLRPINTNHLCSSGSFKETKDARLLPQLNIRIVADGMENRNELLNRKNALSPNYGRTTKSSLQKKTVSDYMPVTKRFTYRLNTINKKYNEGHLRRIDKIRTTRSDLKATSAKYEFPQLNVTSKVMVRRYTSFKTSKTKKGKSHSTNKKTKKYKGSTELKKIPSTSTNNTNTWSGIVDNHDLSQLNHHTFQTQLNKIPQQYFTTPLPMQADDFYRFLKENQMDVASVTSTLPVSLCSKNAKALQFTKSIMPYPTSTKSIKIRYIDGDKKEKLNQKGKTGHKKYGTTPLPNINKSDKRKREVKREHTFTAKDVAALEIVIDMRRNDQVYNEKENPYFRTERTDISSNLLSSESQKYITNAIQVHIALPGIIDNKKRSAESVQVRKVFSAKLASPVDLEYQINSFENEAILPSTLPEDTFSPGIYLILENTNFSDPRGKLVLKPMKINKPDLKIREVSNNVTVSNSPELTTNSIVAYKHGTITKINIKRSVEDRKLKRYIKWDSVKKFFGHDRVCNCRCKANETMCKPCAASDTVISELVFELDNLAKYMQDHCTEIQTFFWMNPTGGKKLREVVNKIDKSLNDYYKRVKGKCQGRTCKMFSSGIEKKRSHRQTKSFEKNDNIQSLLKKLSKLAENLESANILGLFNMNVQYHGRNLIDIINDCMPQVLQKRSNNNYKNDPEKVPRSVYSLDNVNVNLICSPIRKTTYSSYDIGSTTSLYSFTLNDSPSLHSFDYENGQYRIEDETTQRSMKNFFRRRFHSKKNKGLPVKGNKKKQYKNKYDFGDSTQITDARNIFWQDSFRSKRKIKNDTAPIIEVLVKGNDNNIDKSLKTDSLKTKIEFRLNEMTDGTTHNNNIDLDKLYQNTDAKNSLVQNMNVLFNLLGSDIYDSYTQKLDARKTEPRYSNNKKTKLGKNKKYNSHIKYTKSILENSELNKNNITAFNRLRNVTRHFMDFMHERSFLTTNLDASKDIDNRMGRNVSIDVKQTTPRKLNGLSSGGKSSDVITSMTTKDCPTIIIIDDNDYLNSLTPKSQKLKENNKDESERSLLLSVLNFKSKVLNNEWVKASKGNHAKTIDVPDNSLIENTTFNNDSFKDSLSSTKKTTVNEQKGIINKIAHKFPWNRVYTGKKNEVHVSKPPNAKSDLKSESNTKQPKNITGKKSKKSTKVKDETTLAIKNDKLTKKSATKTTKKIGAKKVNTLCDISSTMAHVSSLLNSMNKYYFEKFVKNVNCYKYKPGPTHFLIRANKRKDRRMKRRRNICCKFKRVKRKPFYRQNRKFADWDDARVELDDDCETGFDENELYGYNPDLYIPRQEFVYKLVGEGTDLFEKYKIGYEGIYEPMTRKKRNTDIEELERGLTNLPPFTPLTDEVFVMVGDPVTIDCQFSGYIEIDSEFTWIVDRTVMLNMENVFINGSNILIKDVEKGNYGTYTCYNHNVIARSVKLNVIDVPNFNVVFIQLYRTVTSPCTYNDLRAIQKVDIPMREVLCGDYCSVRIDEPVCLKDRVDNSSLIRAISVVEYESSILSCSAECKRDFKCSMALLIARNAPALASVPVIMIHNEDTLLEEIKTWEPFFEQRKYFVTHTLRRKVICPSDTYSTKGSNICLSCPKGWVSNPGSLSCHLSLQRLRRTTWHWQPYLLMTVILLSSWFIICYGLLRLVRKLLSCRKTRDPTERKKSLKIIETRCYSQEKRQISPSRVILNRLLRVKSIPQATDSQETRMEIWKEENAYPPLPPIDFDS